MKQSIKMPRGQKDVIVHALNHYQSMLEQMVESDIVDANDDRLRYQHFDCRQLIGIMSDEVSEVIVEFVKSDLEETFEEEVKETFAHRGHGVDFPEYQHRIRIK